MKAHRLLLCLFILLPFLDGCRTYYRKNYKFNDYFQRSELENAEKVIASDKKAPKRNNRLLYYLNRGTVSFLLGHNKESNQFFDEAINVAESINKNYALEAASLLSNPNVLPYKGEDFELLMVHYYKALNYLSLHDYEAALVEARQMDIRLGVLSDKYKSNNRYKRDAFIHTLMGLIYDASHDYNNAFIAYRNAYDIYVKDYHDLYGMKVPEQLKSDLLRAAYRTGLPQEVSYYEKKFGISFQPEKDTVASGDLVFFWLNGLGPVKEEWSVNFIIQRGAGNTIMFVNDEYGWAFPFYYQPDPKQGSELDQLKFVRVVLPRYAERPERLASAQLVYNNGVAKSLELGEDVNKIAFQSLQDRVLRELATEMLRVALKKAAELELEKKNKDAGAALGLVNFLTEQPDTRNWQTLPHSIYYTRLKLPTGVQKVDLVLKEQNSRSTHTQSFSFDIRKGQTMFQSFHSIQ